MYLNQPCLVSEAPTKPELKWSLCEQEHPCLSLDNAKRLVLYLHAVDQWIEETNTLCGEQQ